MLLTDYLTTAKPNKHDNSTLFLKQIEGWIRLSRTDAAQLCAMNPATVTALSNELMEAGLIRECGRALTLSGRKPVFLELTPTAGVSAALLLEGTYSRLTIHNLHHEIAASLLLPPLSAGDSLKTLHSSVTSFLQEVLPQGLLGLCVIRGDGAPQDVGDMEELCAQLEKSLPVPVYAAGAVSLCCLSEGHLHYPDTHSCVACLSITPYQVRTGVMFGDQLLFNHFQSGDAGYALNTDRRPPVMLKDRVCLNSLATSALAYRMTHPDAPFRPEDLMGEEAPHLYIMRLAMAGQSAARKLLDDYAYGLSILIYNTVCQYGPSLMVLQHEVLSLLEAAGTRIQKEMDRLFTPGQSRPKIIASQLGAIAPLYGASRFVLRSALSGTALVRRLV